MARVVLTEEAVERSTFVVSVGFVDEAGAAVTPTAARWSLVDAFGQVVNGRDGVVIGALAATVEIVLAGADLQVLGGWTGGGRRLVVQADYFSLGQALTLNEEVEFVVRPLTMSGRSFSYGLTSEDATTAAVARVRLEIGDTTAGAGVLPDGGNLSDEEIGVVLAQYGFDVTETVRALAGCWRGAGRRWRM
jgi:hypothetical protein